MSGVQSYQGAASYVQNQGVNTTATKEKVDYSVQNGIASIKNPDSVSAEKLGQFMKAMNNKGISTFQFKGNDGQTKTITVTQTVNQETSGTHVSIQDKSATIQVSEQRPEISQIDLGPAGDPNNVYDAQGTASKKEYALNGVDRTAIFLHSKKGEGMTASHAYYMLHDNYPDLMQTFESACRSKGLNPMKVFVFHNSQFSKGFGDESLTFSSDPDFAQGVQDSINGESNYQLGIALENNRGVVPANKDIIWTLPFYKTSNDELIVDWNTIGEIDQDYGGGQTIELDDPVGFVDRIKAEGFSSLSVRSANNGALTQISTRRAFGTAANHCATINPSFIKGEVNPSATAAINKWESHSLWNEKYNIEDGQVPVQDYYADYRPETDTWTVTLTIHDQSFSNGNAKITLEGDRAMEFMENLNVPERCKVEGPNGETLNEAQSVTTIMAGGMKPNTLYHTNSTVFPKGSVNANLEGQPGKCINKYQIHAAHGDRIANTQNNFSRYLPAELKGVIMQRAQMETETFNAGLNSEGRELMSMDYVQEYMNNNSQFYSFLDGPNSPGFTKDTFWPSN